MTVRLATLLCQRWLPPVSRTLSVSAVVTAEGAPSSVDSIVTDSSAVVDECAGTMRPVSFVNRNPCNMQRLRLQPKQMGWTLEPDRRIFWYRLVFSGSSNKMLAYIEHYTGERVIMASTREVALGRFLRSFNDVAAAYNLGRVLAHRALKAGLREMDKKFTDDDVKNSKKLQEFVRGVKELGLELEEPPYIAPEPIWAKDRHLKPWLMTEDVAVREQ